MDPRDDRVLLAIDGGNSKTDVAVVGFDGTVLAQFRGAGVSQHIFGARQSVLALEQMVRTALSSAGRALGPQHVRHTAAYLAGVDLPREQSTLLSVVVERAWSESTSVDNDTFALLRVGSPSGFGVAVVCGAGINCVAVDSHGRTIRFPSLGQLSGDWGGGEHLGGEVMFAASRAEDQRDVNTSLRSAVIRHFGTTTVLEVIEAMQYKEIPAERIHELVPVLFDEADAGDAVACALVERLASEVARYAVSALRQLGMLASDAPIVLGGGVLAARRPILVESVERRIVNDAPNVRFAYVDRAPIAGAALLGLDHIGMTVDATVEQRIRRQYGLEQAIAGPLVSAPSHPVLRPSSLPD
ncbi:N-acetylglucosamine kinase [Lacisediminihabitans profunda]|uniref:ATPase n=1 Tax=Lacisediminihabitans profunda TaxID=2594790 RepID=A0A5C8UTE1_9MICO|nr:BadF/BadG/BcrA/BcrD ATPase family protein [Lacisediminihabitans profunda]TXN30929.1 ATPase [Lacisediminihabitans profunda]